MTATSKLMKGMRQFWPISNPGFELQSAPCPGGCARVGEQLSPISNPHKFAPAYDGCQFANTFMAEGIWAIACILVLASTSTNSLCAAREQYSTTGTFEIRQYNSGGELLGEVSADFLVQAEGCKWRIEVEERSGLKRRIGASHDGTNQFSFGGTTLDSPQMVAILKDSVPFMGPEPHLPILWLAYASECYLKTNEIAMSPPYVTDPSRKPLRINVSRRTDGAVRAITFFTGDRTNAVMEVQTFLDSTPLAKAKDCSLRVYNYAGQKSKDPYVALELRASASEWSSEPLRPFSPIIASETTFTDARFTRTAEQAYDFFTYTAERILSTGEVAKIPGFDAYAKALELGGDNPIPISISQSASKMRERRFGVRTAVLAAIGILTGAAVYLLIVKRTKNPPKYNKTP